MDGHCRGYNITRESDGQRKHDGRSYIHEVRPKDSLQMLTGRQSLWLICRQTRMRGIKQWKACSLHMLIKPSTGQGDAIWTFSFDR